MKNKSKTMSKTSTMNYITVLDFETGNIHMYNIKYRKGWDPDSETCEAYLCGKGHNLKNCEWMVHETDTIITD